MAKTIAEKINKSWDLVREYAPSLLLLRATLRPFDDIIICEGAGPQGQSDSDEPYFYVSVQEPGPGDCEVMFRFTANRVTAQSWFTDPEDEEQYCDEEYTTSLDAVYEFMRQVPRSAHSFRRKGARS